MSDQNDTPSSVMDAPTATPDLDAARSSGSWMPWAGIAVAVAWWASCIGIAIALIGHETLLAMPAALSVSGVIAAFLPGALIVMAGFMARETTRASAANALVLEAASNLLNPSAKAGEDAKTLASEMAVSAASVDKAMGHALSAMRAMAGEIGDERMRLESVAYATADNSRDLSERLSNERTALESLAKALKQQTDVMSEAIPHQSAIMIEAARTASEEFASADEALEQRMQSMEGTGNALSAKLVDLDALSVDATKRAETLTFAITRLEEKLEQSQRTVESAVRAGEMAAAAAGTTGDALKDAVSVAIDGARTATTDIQARTRAASEEAAQSLADLRAECDQTVSAIRAISVAARAETDIAEKRLATTSVMIARATEKTVLDLNRPISDRGTDALSGEAAEHAPEATANGQAAPNPVLPSSNDEDLFETADEPTNGSVILPETPSTSDEPVALRQRLGQPTTDDIQHSNGTNGSLPVRPDSEWDDEPVIRRHGDRDAPAAETGTGWADILADIDQENARPRDREETAEELISRLQTSGIKLPEMFKPKDKRKIATAARKGDDQRRNATKDAAGRQIDRVSKRLDADRGLLDLARHFVTGEEDEALQALEQTSKTGRNASPRLSAFLLLDAALSEAARR